MNGKSSAASLVIVAVFGLNACGGGPEGQETAQQDSRASQDARIDRLQEKVSELERKAERRGERDSGQGEGGEDSAERPGETAGQEQDNTEGAIPGDGLFVIGEDIEPGTYRSPGAVDEGGCYWARLSGTSGEPDDIITNGVPTGPVTVTIESSDTAFETVGCQDWLPREEASGSETTSDTRAEPADLIRAFYDSVNAGDYRTAWEMGGESVFGDYEEFAAGYETTAYDDLTITGVDGDTVYVELVAEQTDGSVKLYTGSYTVSDGKITSGTMREVD